jgi:hypothetical protein
MLGLTVESAQTLPSKAKKRLETTTMKNRYLLPILIVLGTVIAGASQASAVCRVADPTPTPLNVRTSPNGRIVSTLENGMLVFVLDRATDRRGQTWVFVGSAEDQTPIGWVFRDYIDCRPKPEKVEVQSCLVADPTPTPLNVRTSPNGRIVSTLENGVLVSVLDRATDSRGQTWVFVGSAEDQTPIGWVFRDYIDCRPTIYR